MLSGGANMGMFHVGVIKALFEQTITQQLPRLKMTWQGINGLNTHGEPWRVALLEQAVVNLVDNAVKYTPSGGSIRLSARHAAGGEVEIESKCRVTGEPVRVRMATEAGYSQFRIEPLGALTVNGR